MVMWMVQPRNSSLVRAYDPCRFWSSLTVVERHNVTGAAPGTWSITGRTEGIADLMKPGNGVLLFRDGDLVLSGPVTEIQRGPKQSTVSGVSDTNTLNDRIIFPDPTKPITAQPTAYDNRSGPAETVLLGYIAANIGSGATSVRKVAALRTAASQGRGSNVSITGRLGQLGETVQDIAESGGLHVDVLHGEDTAPYLGVNVRTVADKSANIRFGTASSFTGGVVGSDWSYTLTRPTVTDAIVAGGGQGVNRIFKEQVASGAESDWAAKVEQMIDQRQTTDSDELTQAAVDAISDDSNPVSVSFTISDSPDIKYRRDWRVGDRVGVFIDGLDLSGPVREVTTTVQAQSGSPSEVISAVVGSRDSSNWTSKTNRDIAKAIKQLRLLQSD